MEVNDIISFDKYFWKVLSIGNDRALIITENIIMQRPYHDEYKETTRAGCALRKYLNGEFYDGFTDEDKQKICTIINKNPDNNGITLMAELIQRIKYFY